MAVQSETELYLPVKRYLETLGFEVKSEVNSCDIVALRDGEETPVIVELKRTFNLALLFQGIERLKLSDRVYLAVERNRKKSGAQNQRWGDIERLCRMLGLGVMTVTMYKTKPALVEVLCEPAPYTPRLSKGRSAKLLNEFRERSGDYNVGGSTKRKLMTAYREKALHCAAMLAEHGPLSPRKLRELTGNAKMSELLQNNYYGWFERVERGIYRLTPQGEAALAENAAVVEARVSTLS